MGSAPGYGDLTSSLQPCPCRFRPFHAHELTRQLAPPETLTIEVKALSVNTSRLEVGSRGTFCQPTTYCQWNSDSNTCGCKPGTDCKDSKVCGFATKDIDCPVGGCYGFRITLPGGFAAEPQIGLPPKPTDFPADKTSFVAASQAVAGDCYHDDKVPEPLTPPRRRIPFQPQSTEPINWQSP